MAFAVDHGDLSPIDSLTAYQILEEYGISKDTVNMHASLIKDFSFATNVMISSFFPGSRCIFTGSGSDGMAGIYFITDRQTDIDVMDIKETFMAIERPDHMKDDSSLFQFRIENDDLNNPAFVKLRLLQRDPNVVSSSCGMSESVFQERNGSHYLSSEEIKVFTKKLSIRYVLLHVFHSIKYFDSIEQQGPASTTNLRNMTFGFKSGFSWENIDVVFAIPFPFWPGVASEWLQRPRRTNWPNSETIDKIKGQGCYMVPKSSKDGCNKSLEWVFSFAHVEPILIKSMNDVMLKTYAFLKLVRIEIFKAVTECQIISSYILKTSLFWEVESTDENEWVPEKLLHCVRGCLRRLQLWIEDEFVPHYFIRSQTLISRSLDPRVKEKILECLTNSISTIDMWFRNIPPFLCIQSRSTDEVIEDYFRNTPLDMEVQLIYADVCRRMTTYLSSISMSSVFASYARRYRMLNHDSIISLKRAIYRLLPVDTSSTCELVSFSVLLVKVISLELALANHRKTQQNIKLSNYLRRLNNGNLVPFLILGNLVQELLQHMMPLDCKKFEKCKRDIEKRMEEMEHFKLNHTDLDNIGKMLIGNISRHLDEILEGRQHREIFVNDIHLTEFELSILPPLLRLEQRCRLDINSESKLRLPEELILSLDSEALFYFLCFLFYHKLDRNIEKYRYLRKLESSCHRIGTLHRHLAWNLYGHCLSDMGQYREAFRAYFTSMFVQTKNVDLGTMSKATPWHVAILLNKCPHLHRKPVLSESLSDSSGDGT